MKSVVPTQLPGPWQPILGEGARRPVLEIIRSIAAGLSHHLDAGSRELPREHASEYIFHLASAALFFAYLSRVPGEEARSRTAGNYLDAAIELVEKAPEVRMGLFYGAAGLGWALHHVGRLLGTGAGDATEVLDEALLESLQDSESPHRLYDLMGGLVGLGVYGFEAGNRTLVNRVVLRLEECAEEDGDGVTWHTPPELAGRAFFAQGHYNLGLAHGVAGVIAFLAGAIHLQGEASPGRRLLSGSIRWLQLQRLSEEDRRLFPWAVAPGSPPLSWGYDPGWAYADAGIATALLHAARATDDQELEREALAVGRHDARHFSDVPDRNPGIGFGPAGYAQIFARLYQLTGRTRFRRAGQEALQRLLALRDPRGPFGGFFSVDKAGERQPPDVGFLAGVSGIGLVLLGAVSDVDPRWDRLLLLSPLRLGDSGS